MLKAKLLNLGLILTSLVGYLEWGGGRRAFLFEAEATVLEKLFTDPLAASHPFTLIPLLGQLILLGTLFQKVPSNLITLAGIVCLSLLMLLISFIGIISLNLLIFLSTVPFIVIATLRVIGMRRPKRA
ncbi:MAG: hypothetical protein LC113_07110 [Acidobacteria bacterium]|nr:hypothetical protein [Acidobacteriota bacterium]